ncbi:hypothetical protein [Brevibacterium epidermidis]|uniref:hypothetical protein n=1 Tax=Brevibacterium epidermidis TaxID=1698 RepID=UPI000BF6F2BA|nr:hypothetical protein [Brevibacterium epidermidis]
MPERRYEIGPSWTGIFSCFGILLAFLVATLPISLSWQMFLYFQERIGTPWAVVVTVLIIGFIIGIFVFMIKMSKYGNREKPKMDDLETNKNSDVEDDE